MGVLFEGGLFEGGLIEVIQYYILFKGYFTSKVILDIIIY